MFEYNKSQLAGSYNKNKTVKQHSKVYADAKDISNLLNSIKKDISKENITEFVFDCAMYAVYNPSECGKINKIINSNFKDYQETYTHYLIREIVRKNMTPENMRRLARNIDKSLELINKIHERQRVTPEYWQMVNNKMERSFRYKRQTI